MRAASAATALTLAGIGAVHVAWGLGSSFPLGDRAALADAVVGSDTVPGAPESFAVASLLGVAAALVADVIPGPASLRRLGVVGVATVLGVRAGFGFAGRTHLLVPGSDSPRFRRNDRFVFAPLCAGLAAGALMSLGD